MRKQVLIIPFFLMCLSVFSQGPRVVGYLPYYRFGLIDNIDFNGLTHVCLAFANPDLEGNLSIGGADIAPIVNQIKDAGAQVLVSLAGGALTPAWSEAWEHHMLAENSTAFIHQILNYVRLHDLDGIDFDLEWGDVNEKYSPFVLELADSLFMADKLLTAALPGTTRYADISDEAMHAFDFINMMVYDLTGPWAPNNPGPHSPYSFAIDAITYWQGQGAQTEKLTLGLPFYGYDFSNQTNVQAFRFGDIVAENPALADVDQDGERYYNGRPTIAAKTMLGMEEVSGVMIWELGQDAFNEYSLLQTIYQTVYGSVHTIEEQIDLNIQIFPNPTNDFLQIRNDHQLPIQGRIFNLQGQELLHFQVKSHTSSMIQVGHWPAASYILQIQQGKRTKSFKFQVID